MANHSDSCILPGFYYTILIQQKCPTVSKHLFLQIAVRLFNIYYNQLSPMVYYKY
jgi:hypothetical protein